MYMNTTLTSKLLNSFSVAPYPKHRPIAAIARAIITLRKTKKHISIAIAGPSGGGKTFLVEKLTTLLADENYKITHINQDDFFVEDLAHQSFSGHNPAARTSKLHSSLSKAETAHDGITFVYSNAALLYDELLDHFDLKIAVTPSSIATLLARRLATKKDSEKFLEHFFTKTLPDISAHTLPSLAKADVLLITDSPNSVYTSNTIANTPKGQAIISAMNHDPSGWDALWDNNATRFTTNPTPLAKTLVEQLPIQDYTVVEIGPGATGRDAELFLEHGASYIGLEISSLATKHLQEKLDKKFPGQSHNIVNGDIRTDLENTLKNIDGPVVVHSHSSLHYFTPNVLDQILDCIQTQAGYLSVGLKSTDDVSATKGIQHNSFSTARVYENHIHRQMRFYYSMDEIKTLLKRHNFQPIHLKKHQEYFDAKKTGKPAFADFISCVAKSV